MNQTNQKPRKEKKLNLKVTEEFRSKLNRAAGVLDIPYAQIVRMAVDEKLEALASTNPALRAALDDLPAAA